jgi:hypothetical protein
MVVRREAGDLLVIDFRYHLISIVAVLLALSVGVILGSGLLGEPLLDDIKSNVEGLEDQLDRRRDEIADLTQEASEQRRFAEQAAPHLLAGVLEGVPVVVLELDGVDGDVVSDLRESIGAAGGTVASRIEINERVVLEDQTDRDSLALTLGASIGGDADELRVELAQALGDSMAAAATDGRGGGSSAASAVADLDALLSILADDGFITLDQETEGRPVPLGTAFVVIGGAPDEADYDVASFTSELAAAMTAKGASLVVAETSDSVWELVSSVLDAGELRDTVVTSFGVEDVVGRTATVMGLAHAIDGEVGHYGRGSGSERVIPDPTTSP